MKLNKNELIQRWEQLSARERLMVVGAGLALLFYSFYLILYAPIASETQILAQKIDAQQRIYLQLQNIAQQVLELRQSAVDPNGAIETSPQSLMAIVDNSSTQMALKPTIKRVIPDGVDEVTLWLENIAFDTLSHWLAILETKHGIHVNQISINSDGKQIGIVNAKVLLASPAKTE
ncbi:MAG: type II secretion system protein M [Methylococcaceae bacterium]